MKVLFYHLTPFALAHGGLLIQILQSRSALPALGVQVEFLRWNDEKQTADILHFFGRVPIDILRSAHAKGMKVVQAELLTAQGARSRLRLALEKMVRAAMGGPLPRRLIGASSSDSYRLSDACVALTEWEAMLMKTLYGAPPRQGPCRA